MSTFSGINLASRALTAANKGVTLTGQNIANVNTEGYSRQRAEQVAMDSVSSGVFAGRNNPGNGVEVTDISRATDGFVDARQRGDHSASAYSTQVEATYSDAEDLLNEPSAEGLTKQLQGFWGAWKDLANDTGDTAAQAQVLNNGQAVATTLNTLDSRLSQQWSNLKDNANTLASSVNDTAAKVADLNLAIRKAQANGQNANELMDQRDQNILKLSDLVDVSTSRNSDGTYDVSVGGSTLVHGTDTVKVKVSDTPTNLRSAMAGQKVTLVLDQPGNQATVGIVSGKLAAHLDSLNTLLPDVARQFDAVADKIATSVNGIYSAGGAPFFGPTPGPSTAATLAVVPTDPTQVKGSTAGKNADMASALGKLSESTTGPDSLWRAKVTDIGNKSAAATTKAGIAQTTAQNSDGARESVSGVNIDEEMVNLVTYQHAYSSAAKVFTAMDEMIQTVLNMVR